ncbi:MAG: hypothetical protein ACYDDA_01785 [Acidiferrobacteraceae bacterium]
MSAPEPNSAKLAQRYLGDMPPDKRDAALKYSRTIDDELAGEPSQGDETEWPEPQPLPDGLPAVPVFDETLLPEAIRPWVTVVANLWGLLIGRPGMMKTPAMAQTLGISPQTARKNHCEHGACFGIRPLKAPSAGRLLWPVAGIARVLNGEAA